MLHALQRDPLPTLRALTRELRQLHEAWQHEVAGEEVAALCLCSNGTWHMAPVAFAVDWAVLHFGCERVGGVKFDAVASARRLLAAARDGGFK